MIHNYSIENKIYKYLINELPEIIKNNTDERAKSICLKKYLKILSEDN